MAARAAGLGCLLAGAVAAQAALDRVQVDPQTGHFVDESGRVRIFHGVNVVYKKAPWFPPSGSFNPYDSLDGTTMDLLHQWGFNVVRLGIMWPGVEPSLGKIDASYLREVARLAEELSGRGVYILADLHQDIGSRRFCGEGFPEHYVDALAADPTSAFAQATPFPSPLPISLSWNDTGIPSLEECLNYSFAEFYFTDKVGALWAELYRPGSSLNQGFSRFWKAVAEALGEAPHVLAYELLNEPSGICISDLPFKCTDTPAVVGSIVEDQKLTPLYRSAGEAIRAVDPAKPILFEATITPKLPGQLFSQLPLGNDTQQGLAYHIYCQAGDGKSAVAGLVCRAAQDLYSHQYYSFLKQRPGLAGFMTEFGAIGDSMGELQHLNRLLNLADSQLQSWAYWQLKKYGDFTTANQEESLYDADGNLQMEKLRMLSRTYAPAIAGEPRGMTFDAQRGFFELMFVPTLEDIATELYLNEELHYPGGYDLRVDPPNCLRSAAAETNRVHLVLIKNAGCKGSIVTVTVARRAQDALVV